MVLGWLQSAIIIKIVIGVIMFAIGWIAKKLKIPLDDKAVKAIVLRVVKAGMVIAEQWKSKNEESHGIKKLTKRQKTAIHGSAADGIREQCIAAHITPPIDENLDLLIKGAVKDLNEKSK